MHCCTQCPWPCSRPLLTHASAKDSWTLMGKSGSVSFVVTVPFSWVLVCTKFCLCPPRRLGTGIFKLQLPFCSSESSSFNSVLHREELHQNYHLQSLLGTSPFCLFPSHSCSLPDNVAQEHFIINPFLLNPVSGSGEPKVNTCCFFVVQLLSHVPLFVTPWTATYHAVLAPYNMDWHQYLAKDCVVSKVVLVTAWDLESLIQAGLDLLHTSKGYRKSVDSRNSILGNLDAHILRMWWNKLCLTFWMSYDCSVNVVMMQSFNWLYKEPIERAKDLEDMSWPIT